MPEPQKVSSIISTSAAIIDAMYAACCVTCCGGGRGQQSGRAHTAQLLLHGASTRDNGELHRRTRRVKRCPRLTLSCLGHTGWVSHVGPRQTDIRVALGPKPALVYISRIRHISPEQGGPFAKEGLYRTVCERRVSLTRSNPTRACPLRTGKIMPMHVGRFG